MQEVEPRVKVVRHDEWTKLEDAIKVKLVAIFPDEIKIGWEDGTGGTARRWDGDSYAGRWEGGGESGGLSLDFYKLASGDAFLIGEWTFSGSVPRRFFVHLGGDLAPLSDEHDPEPVKPKPRSPKRKKKT